LAARTPARIVAPELSGMRMRVVARGPTASEKHAVSEPKPNMKMPVRLASLERATRPMEAIPSRIPSKVSPLTGLGHQKSAGIVAHELSSFQARAAERDRATVKHAMIELPQPRSKPLARLASLEGAAPPVQTIPSRIPSNIGALTSLVHFETAPFPYHGTMPGSGRPFLNADTEGN